MKAVCICGFTFFTEFTRGVCPVCLHPIVSISTDGICLTAVEHRVKELADDRWPGRDIPNRLRKLGEEFGELSEAVARGNDEEIFLEAADCAIVLADLLALQGKSLTVAMMVKLEINANKERQ